MIQNGQQITASDFINKAEKNATPANDEGRVAKLEDNGRIDPVFISPAIGGNGSNGALTVSSGTTNIDLGGAQYVVKNYTSISITGTGAITFSNPHAKGTIVVFKVQGDVVITSTAARAIDLRGIGAAVGEQPTGGVFTHTIPSSSTAGSQYSTADYFTDTYAQYLAEGRLHLVCGTAGADGGTGPDGGAGVGGRGGGVLLLEIGGSYQFSASSTMDASGQNGTNAGAATGTNEASGGGGGGSAGMIVALYNELVTDAGTYTLSGGNGGSSGAPLGPTGTGGVGGGGAGSRKAAGGNGGTTTSTPAANGSNAAGAGAGAGGGCGQASTSAAARPGGTGGSSLSAIRGTYN